VYKSSELPDSLAVAPDLLGGEDEADEEHNP
jgi:hypothetical protein